MSENEYNQDTDESIRLEEEPEVVEEEGLTDKLKKIRKELEACRKEKEEYLAGWQRAKADLINARKDGEKAKAEFVKFAEEDLLKELFSLADSLGEATKTEGSEGFENIYRQLQSIFKAHGVEAVESKGKKFNPAEHEAIGREEVQDGGQDEMVLEEFSRGYRVQSKVLRPARVKVGHYRKL
ncbi:MAG: nucleotide exchange factor GrpE [Patescibacteria group bacterium]